MCDSLWPHRLYSPWNSPGQNTRVGSLSLLQGSYQPRDWTQVSHIACRFFTSWATREAHLWNFLKFEHQQTSVMIMFLVVFLIKHSRHTEAFTDEMIWNLAFGLGTRWNRWRTGQGWWTHKGSSYYFVYHLYSSKLMSTINKKYSSANLINLSKSTNFKGEKLLTCHHEYIIATHSVQL